MEASTYLLALTAVGGIFTALSRSAIDDFSLSDIEELLRKRQRTKEILPKIEYLAERLEAVAFSFGWLDIWLKALALLAIHDLLAGLPALTDHTLWRWLAILTGFGGFVLLTDVPFKPIGAAFSERITLALRPVWLSLYALLVIPNAVFRLVYLAIGSFLRRHDEESGEEQAEEDIRAAVALGELQGQISEDQGEMIQSILSLNDCLAEAIMTPRTEMDAVPLEGGLQEAMKAAQETGRSRLPVYGANRDDIIGILYVKDVIGVDPDMLPDLRTILRKPFVVPTTKPVSELLGELRRHRVHLAVVVDEYGGTAGLVTIEDIIEEVFGEIEDEYDAVPEEEMRHLTESAFDLDARMKVAEVNERLDLNLPESENYESLGGFITTMLGYIPQVGATWVHEDNARLTVQEATDRRVVRIHLERTGEAGTATPTNGN